MPIVSVSVTRKNNPVPSFAPWDEVLRTPKVGQAAIVVHDADPQLDYWFEGKPRQKRPDFEQDKDPMPATRPVRGLPIKPSGFVSMRDDWQMRQFELMQWAAGGRMTMGEPIKWFLVQEKEKRKYVPKGTIGALPEYPPDTLMGAWHYLFRDHAVYTDANSYDTFSDQRWDAVQNINPAGKPYCQKELIMTGNAVQLKGKSPVPGYHQIDALDGTKPAPPLEWILEHKPHCILALTEQGITKLPDGRWNVSRFWHLEAAGVGTPIFLLAKQDSLLIRKEYVRLIGNDEAYSPYVPERFLSE
jgi:hypothetical protein